MALERFSRKRVEMNYHARLVLFLRDQGIITQEEADAQLHPAVAGGYKTPSLPGPLGWAGMKRLASVQGAILGAMALAVAFVHASQIGAPPPVHGGRPAAAAKPPGFLKVLVDPWAEVWIDGKYTDTTPFKKALPHSRRRAQNRAQNPFFVRRNAQREYQARRVGDAKWSWRANEMRVARRSC